MASVKIDSKKKKKGYALFLAVNHGRNQRKLISLKLTVPAKYWNAKAKEIRKSHKDHIRLNRLINDSLTVAVRVIDEMVAGRRLLTLETFTDNIRAELFGEKIEIQDGDFFEFCDTRLKEYSDRNQIATFRAYRTAVKKLKTFVWNRMHRNTLPYELCSVDLFRAFHTHMIKDLGNAPNTVHKNMTSLRTLMHEAIRAGHMSRNDDPFFSIKLKKQKTQRGRITPEEIKAIAELELEEETGIWHNRNEFLFAFYSGGMRYGDVCLFKWSHVRYDGVNYRSRFKMKKVSDGAGIVLVPNALDILRRYGNIDDMIGKNEYVFYPLRSRKPVTELQIFNGISGATTICNRHLKVIAAECGIKTRLTTHMARHSIAKYLDEQGWDIYDIMEILGHTKVSTTQEYLRGFQSKRLDDNYQNLFE